jgi:hypothetical protein
VTSGDSVTSADSTSRPAATGPVNHLSDVAAFRRAWDRGRPAGDPPPPPQRRGPHGHINLTGSPDEPSAADLVPHDRRFWSEIEPGVLPLVFAVVSLGLITYSSCEGHQRGQAYGEPKLYRHVGVLPRDGQELRTVTEVAAAASLRYANLARPGWCASLTPVPRTLTDDRGAVERVLDLTLVADPATPPGDYFACVDAATTVAIGALVESWARMTAGRGAG